MPNFKFFFFQEAILCLHECLTWKIQMSNWQNSLQQNSKTSDAVYLEIEWVTIRVYDSIHKQLKLHILAKDRVRVINNY